MMQEDFYTGEPIITGSPISFGNSVITEDKANEIEAANMASFGAYAYDPGVRRQAVSTPNVYPGGYGYNQYPQQQAYYNPNPVYGAGIGANPYGYSQYGNPQPTYQMYRPNPVFQAGYNVPIQYQQQQMPTTITIPGVGISGEYMPPADYQDRISELESKYWLKQQEYEVEQSAKRQNSVYGNGYYSSNYYGSSYYTPYYNYNSPINQDLIREIDALKEEARQNRLAFDMQISKLAHNFAGSPISDEDLRERYVGKTIPIPTSLIQTPQEAYEMSRFDNMEPYDNSQMYRNYQAAVTKEYNDIIPPDSNMKETFELMGVLWAKWEMEDEMHRRKDASGLYNAGDNSYKYFVRKKVQERYAREHGLDNRIAQVTNFANNFNAHNMLQSFVNSSPTLSESATLDPDGTLNLSIRLPSNVGSNKGSVYTVSNSEEAAYDEKRERFNRFIDSIPGNIYLDQIKERKKAEYDGSI